MSSDSPRGAELVTSEGCGGEEGESALGASGRPPARPVTCPPLPGVPACPDPAGGKEAPDGAGHGSRPSCHGEVAAAFSALAAFFAGPPP